MPHEHLAPLGTSQDIPYAETSLIKSISHLGDLCPKDRFPLRFAPSPWHCSSPASCPVPPMPWHHRLVELRAPAQRRPREGSTASLLRAPGWGAALPGCSLPGFRDPSRSPNPSEQASAPLPESPAGRASSSGQAELSWGVPGEVEVSVSTASSPGLVGC